MTPPSMEMCFSERLLLGAIHVYIVFGVAIRKPVGMALISPGAMEKFVIELTSYPIEPGVARLGILAVGIIRWICTD